MKTLARLGLISVVALPLVACGGREIYDFPEDELSDTGVSTDTSVSADTDLLEDTSIIPEEDAPWWDDSPAVDSGVVPSKDTGVTPSKDTGVTPSKDTGTIGTDTSIPPDASTPIATACSKIAKSTCTPAFEMCCKSHGFAYDSLACDDVSRQWCDDAADGVVAGKTTYNPAWADACAAGWANNTSACQPHIFEWVKNQAPCSQLFNGTVAVGGVCTRSSDCRAGLGEFAYCDETARRCRTIAIVGPGQTCNYFGAAIRWCDRTLTCDTSTARCVAATPIGGTCFGADDTSCGIGNSCRAGKCALGAAPGASCTRDLECASWECSFGKCTDIRYTVASKILCSGI